MYWVVFFAISAVCLVLSVVFAVLLGKVKYKSGRMLDSSRILFIGVVLSAVILFIPIYINDFSTGECGVFETLMISIHNMIRLFIVDGEFDFVTDNISGLSGWIYHAYSWLFAILYVLAPIMTFGFILSFFKNLTAYKRYITHYNSDVYIFSELNEKSLALATSLYENNPKKRFIVFNDVFEKDEQSFELIEKAKELGAVCFKKDITTVDFSFHNKNSRISFFAIGEDQSENINQALNLIDKFRYREKTNLYVFSTHVESEMLLTNAYLNKSGNDSEQCRSMKMKVRRVSEVQSLIFRILYEDGYDKIFASAAPIQDGIRHINAVVIGMGKHGTEMTKALPWFCQMYGYQVEINSFDIDKAAEDKFRSQCPELMDERYNGNFDFTGDARYKITIHSGIDVNTKTFDDIIAKLPRATYVFVALGEDEMNISAAEKMRRLYLRLGCEPVIQAVVYNTKKKEALSGTVNFKNQKYNIDFIGDVKTTYSESVILDSDVEEEALKRHLKWGSEDEFWQFDYNYKSSVASAIHHKMKILCGIPGSDKPPLERNPEEALSLRILEHCRWNAYIRSEGYVFGGTIESSGRNDLAKTHNCLVPYDKLSPKEQAKDND